MAALAGAITAWGEYGCTLRRPIPTTWTGYWTTLTISPNAQLNVRTDWDLVGYFSQYLPALLVPAPWAAVVAAHPALVRALVIAAVAGVLVGHGAAVASRPRRRDPGRASVEPDGAGVGRVQRAGGPQA